MLAKPCLLLFTCPGDSGDTVVYWKGSASIETNVSSSAKVKICRRAQ